MMSKILGRDDLTMSWLLRYGSHGCVLPALLLVAATVSADDRAAFTSALETYQRALDEPDRDRQLAAFGQAELAFEQLLDEDESTSINNEELFVNLGNAALGAEHLGNAILAYRRALLIDPDHRTATQNLTYARTLLPSWVPTPEGDDLFTTFLGGLAKLSVNEQRMIAASCFFAAALLLAAAIYWQRPSLRLVAVVPAIGWLVFFGLSIWQSVQKIEQGVIIVDDVIARTADSSNSPAQLSQSLPAGVEVEIQETRSSWLQVRFADGRDAWLPQSAVGRVR